MICPGETKQPASDVDIRLEAGRVIRADRLNGVVSQEQILNALCITSVNRLHHIEIGLAPAAWENFVELGKVSPGLRDLVCEIWGIYEADRDPLKLSSEERAFILAKRQMEALP